MNGAPKCMEGGVSAIRVRTAWRTTVRHQLLLGSSSRESVPGFTPRLRTIPASFLLTLCLFFFQGFFAAAPMGAQEVPENEVGERWYKVWV